MMEVSSFMASNSVPFLQQNHRALLLRGGAAVTASAVAHAVVLLPHGGGKPPVTGTSAHCKHLKLYTALLWSTVFGAGASGLAIFFPAILTQIGVEQGEHIAADSLWYQMLGTSWLSVSALSLLALTQNSDPVKWSPLFLWQLCYKTLWLLLGVLPRVLFQGEGISLMNWAVVAVFASVVVLDALALPWGYLLERGDGASAANAKKK